MGLFVSFSQIGAVQAVSREAYFSTFGEGVQLSICFLWCQALRIFTMIAICASFL